MLARVRDSWGLKVLEAWNGRAANAETNTVRLLELQAIWQHKAHVSACFMEPVWQGIGVMAHKCCRYTKAWEERAADAKAKEARLRELLAIQRHKLQSTFRTPF